MFHLYQSAFLEALGWSLVDSLWQMGGLWFLYTLLTFNGNRYSSNVRHNLAFFGVAGGTVWFFLTLVSNYQAVTNNGISHALASWKHLHAAIPALSSAYLFAVAFFSLRLFIHLTLNNNGYRKTLVDPTEEMIDYLQRISEKLKITRKISIWLSEKAESPLTIGFFKPLILVPVAALSQLTPSQLEAVIAHELFHIRRNDFLLNKLLLVAEVILFFNPFARIMVSIVKKERENCCDDQVLALGYNAWEYSQALYLLGKNQSTANRLVLSAIGTGKNFLLGRIKRLLKLDSTSPSFIKPLTTFFLCLTVAFFSSRKPGVQVIPQAQTVTSVVQFSPVPQVYIEEKKIEITLPGKKTENAVKKRTIRKMTVIVKTEVTKSSVHKVSSDIKNEMNIASFASDPEILEFTIIEHRKPQPPKPVIGECTLPYVPESTFYYPEAAIAAPRKVIDL